MQIARNTIARFHYQLNDEQGELIEDSRSGEPMAYLEIYFPPDVGARLERHDFITAGQPVIRVVERRLNVRVARAQQTIASSVAGETAAAHLGLQPSDPVLFVTRAYYLASGRPIEAVFVRYHPGRYSYVIDFAADSRKR